MGVAVLVGLLALASQSDTSIAVGERPERAVMLVISPRASTPNIPSSAYLDAAQRVFGRETSLSLASAEQAGIDASAMRECPVDLRLRCWSKLARPDDRNIARYLLVLILQPVGGSDRATLLLLDLDGVQRILGEAGRSEDTEAQEQSIFELATQLEPVVLSPEEEGAAERFIEDAVLRDLRAPLESSGHLRPYGQVEVLSNTEDLAIDLDGRIIGTTSGRPLTLREVLPGERVLSIRRADGWSAVTKVRVERGHTVRVELPDSAERDSPRAALRLGGWLRGGRGRGDGPRYHRSLWRRRARERVLTANRQ